MSSPVDLLIVGAGPVGLTTALAALANGVRPRILDKHATWSPLSKAITLTPRTLECYKMLGVSDRCLEEGILSRRIHHYMGRGREFATAHVDSIQSEFLGLLHLGQARTIEILAAALEARGVAIERPVTCVDVAEKGGLHHVTVEREGGRREVIEARYVVGADGSNSQVRASIGAAFDGEEQTETFIMADILMEGFPYDPEDRHIFYVDETFLAILPIDGRHYRLISTCRLESSSLDEPFVIRRLEALLKSVGLDKTAISTPFWIARFNPRQFVADRFRSGGVFLAGDAAHIQSPIGAQGLNTGIQDAINLAWKLGLVMRGRAGDSLLESYHRERRPVACRLFEYNNRISERVFGTNRVRRHVLRYENYLLRVPSVHAKEVSKISQFHIDYAGCGLVDAEPSRGATSPSTVRAGARMPHAPLVREDGSPFDLLTELGARRHIALVFGSDHGGAPWVESTIAALDDVSRGEAWCVRASERASPRQKYRKAAGDTVVYDPAGRWRRSAGLEPTCAVVVRPDGHVAAKFVPGEESRARDYFKRLAI